MNNRKNLEKIADKLLKNYDDSHKLTRISTIASSLASSLTGVSETTILKSEILKQIPKLKELLQERMDFYKNKSKEFVNRSAIKNYENEIDKCDKILEEAQRNEEKETYLVNIRWINYIKEKYGF
jgi:hypothetical protein